MVLPRPVLAALAGLVLSLFPLRAQLAPGSPWQAYKWDLSNLYTGTGTTNIRPEILMLLDDTGSTSRLMFHPLFPQNWQDEAPPNAPANGNSGDWSVIIKFSSYPTSASPTPNGLSVGFTQGGLTTGGAVAASGTSYTLGGNRTTVTVNGVAYPVNTLIKPDGTEVTWKDVPATHPPAPYASLTNITVNPKNDPVNWLMCASHVRMQCTKGGVTRTIDFPLSWQMMDYPGALPANPWVPGTTTGPLVKATAYDPVGRTSYAMDTTNPGVKVDNVLTPTVAYMDGGYYTGTGYIRSRYLEWVFWGQDPNATGGAAYCIPNAIPSATASVLYAIMPNNYTPPYPLPNGYTYPAGYYYNGATDAWTVTGYTNTACPAFSNNLPQRTRGQAIKECVIKTWLTYQNNVLLALRTFDATGQTCSSAISNSSSTMTFGSTNWIYLDPTQVATQVPALAANPWSTGDSTPLAASTLSSLCQMMNPAAFAPLIAEFGYTQSQLQCQQHFLVILTDGAPSETPSPAEGGVSNYPYYQTAAPNSNPAYTGNALIAANPGNLTSTYWNNPTLAGMAAHGGDGSLSTPTWIRNPLAEGLTGNLSSLTAGQGWAPFWVKQRTVGGNAFTLTNAQAIQTMTVGVSLGVDYYAGTSGTTLLGSATTPPPSLASRPVPLQIDYGAAKFRLLASATFGDPTSDSYSIASAVPFYLNPGTTVKTPDAAYFFDGRDPGTLVANLDAAFNQIVLKAGTTTTSTPIFPTQGAGLGNEVYLGMFLPPVNPGPIWTGDVLMFPTQPTATGTVLTDNNGQPLTSGVSVANAQWSAANAIATRGWTNRVIYTRLPPTAATGSGSPTAWNPSLTRINLGATGTLTADPGFTAALPYLPGASSTLKLENWQFFVGADVGGTTSPLPTRSTFNALSNQSYLMGDVVNSAPAVLQYSTLPASVASASAVLGTAWNLYNPVNGSQTASVSGGAFKMIFVGDNQGLFHALGEVSWVTTSNNVTHGVVDELWAFAPTEVLPSIDQLQSTTNRHYYAVDGAPSIYLLDLPQTATQATGNGIFDLGAAYPERAMVVFGLGKGGRSYYCLNIADPGTPLMQWALCPNEQYNCPGSRILGGSASVIAAMGLATPQPTFARVFTSLEGTVNQIVDVVLLGGGYSDPNIEAALPATATATNLNSMPAQNTPLGRGAVAVDVWSGNILNTWSTAGTSGAGPVTAAVIPLDLVNGSGIDQRAYFTDYYGSLWALGGTAPQVAPYTMFRTDTPAIANWNVRQVYTQPVTAGSPGNGLLTTFPTPFLLPYFPVTRTTAPLVAPSAVGLAFVTGDRNNPLDTYTYTSWSAPTQNRLNVVFDRLDMNTPITASGLANAASSFDANPADTTFYLKASYGYYGNFAAPAGGFVPKGVNTPLVLDGNLFYSVFSPTNTSCNGGLGTTSTYQVCNVMAPILNPGTAASATAVNGCQSGQVLSWTGLASNLTSRTILTGVQAGLTSGSGTNNNPDASQQNLVLQNLLTNSSNRFPKIRVWRVVH